MKKLMLVIALSTGFLMNAQEFTPGVSVSGEGTVYVEPDQVVVNIAIENQGDFVKEVKKQTEDSVDKVLDFLKKKGIPAKNIQTEYIHLDKQQDYQTKTQHYSSRQAISIKIENIENYEEILTGLMEAGVNRINGISFKSSQAETLEAQARAKAVKDAKAKAEDYATALGQKIGKAMAISDVSGQIRPVYAEMAFKSMDAASGGGQKDTIAPGQLAITANVTVLFSLY